ncbi:hypothetical protein RWE15_04600 [Virgibacillus halophilus]|uniref:YpzG-like protein n=1 Tax=Tigheibacillus halophilus TaxID=361280 RepID=A0ABU5C3I1_9BACI|nr:hypothetical protein [Virgibacillus halophilus]
MPKKKPSTCQAQHHHMPIFHDFIIISNSRGELHRQKQAARQLKKN